MELIHSIYIPFSERYIIVSSKTGRNRQIIVPHACTQTDIYVAREIMCCVPVYMKHYTRL